MTSKLGASARLNASGSAAFVAVAVLLLVSRGSTRGRLLIGSHHDVLGEREAGAYGH